MKRDGTGPASQAAVLCFRVLQENFIFRFLEVINRETRRLTTEQETRGEDVL